MNWLLGRRLATSEEEHQRVGVSAGVPMLGLDGLASAAYGPEAALAVLIPLGVAGAGYIVPVTGVILALLAVLYFSYRQTIAAYPGGGGSYTVAKSNLGKFPGLLAAAALLLDYVLVVAVGISAGVAALVSAVPSLHSYILPLCLGILVLITLVNLRGVRESGVAFMVPTYGFIALLALVIGVGIVKSISTGGNPTPVEPLPPPTNEGVSISLWLLMRSFASGCTAMTGVEAVSNGVTAFKDPPVLYAQRTLTVIVLVLALLLGGLAYLTKAYGIAAMSAENPSYQSIISQITSAVVGRGPLYYAVIGFVLAVLALSANTGFADFPRLCRLLALDDYLPHAFAGRGRRLVFTGGILVLALLSAALLVAFKGLTEGLIPLFAVGAFLAFTLSQAGMVMHWWKDRGRNWRVSLFINALGCASTAVALVVILVAKFAEGAWVMTLLIPAMLFLFVGVRRHYVDAIVQTRCTKPLGLDKSPPLVVVPIQRWSSISEQAMRFAIALSPTVQAIHISHDRADTDQLKADWIRYVEQPLSDQGLPVPPLVIIHSPYRRVLSPILEFLRESRRLYPDRNLAVVIPELIESKWLHNILHNQRATALKAALLFGGDNRTVVINSPWYLR